MEWYLKVVRDNYANFNGRATRQEYWMFNLFHIIFFVFLMFIDPSLALYYIYTLATFIPGFGVTVRRMHDIGKSGWWGLIIFIPIIGSIWFFILLCTDSQKGTNEYGESPKYGSSHHEVEKEIPDIQEQNEPAKTVVEEAPVRSARDPMPISLNVENGPRQGSFYAVSKHSRIGRAPDNDIVLNANTVSSYHAEIFVKDGQFHIKDMESTNGTKVNGERVSESPLTSGTKLKIGETELTVD